jgi:hypothetical protein
MLSTELPTYQAVYRLAARPYAISNAFGAAGRKQFATIYHPATALKTVRLCRVTVSIESSSAAAIIVADLIRLTATTAPATGHPAITPDPTSAGLAAAEATCLVLPTTAGSEAAQPFACQEWNLGITGTAPLTNPPPPVQEVVLYDTSQGGPNEVSPLIIRANLAEGWAVTIDCSAASTVKGFVRITFTEG